MKYLFIGLAVVVLAVVPCGGASGQDPLGPARELYAAARYEDALKALDAILASQPAPGLVLSVQQHRALCLLALSRKPEAERAIEAVLDLDPFYQPGEDDAAPWVRAAFREVRQRVLPGVLQQLYGRAKQAFDRKDWPDASASFTRVLKVLGDEDLTLDKGARADMRIVVQGFLDLADAAARMTPQAPPPAPQPPEPAGGKPAGGAVTPPGQLVKPAGGIEPGAQPAAPAKPTAEDEAAVYDGSVTDVVPPLPLRQSLPITDSQRPIGPSKEGSVEIVIGATGNVESAQIRQSLGAGYDALVLQAVNGWRYRPAMKAGKPVRYRRLVRVVIPGREPRG